MIQVTVNFHNILQPLVNEVRLRSCQIEVLPGSTLATLFNRFQFTVPEDSILFLVNHQTATLETEIKNGDTIDFMLALEGG